MAYISLQTFAENFGVSERTVRNWCASGKIDGAYLVGNTWNIPEDSQLPKKKTAGRKASPLLKALREQKDANVKLYLSQLRSTVLVRKNILNKRCY